MASTATPGTTGAAGTTSTIEVQQAQQNVANAALALVQPTTDAATRSQASKFLEEWNATKGPDAWVIYSRWLSSFRTQEPAIAPEQMGMQLLCLTMLQSRVRSMLTVHQRAQQTESRDAIQAVQNDLWQLLRHLSQLMASTAAATASASTPTTHTTHNAGTNHPQIAIIAPCCNCIVGLTVRCGDTAQFVHTLVSPDAAASHHGLIPELCIRLLGSLPRQIEDAYGAPSHISASADLQSSPMAVQELRHHLAPVLVVLRQGMMSGDGVIMLTSLQALREWNSTCHVTLSELNMQGHSEADQTAISTLSLLIQLLSVENPLPPSPSQTRQQQDEHNKLRPQVWQAASQALCEALMIPSDHLTPLRQTAAGSIYTAIHQQGMIRTPLQVCTQQINNGGGGGVDDSWEDSVRDLGMLLCTFVLEELDDVIQQPAENCLTLLLELTSHPQTPVVLNVLDVWLAVLEMEVAQRHANWRGPLFDDVCNRLLRRMSLPATFTTWEEELDLDSSSFEELRRMIPDVLVASYYLSRVFTLRVLGLPIQELAEGKQQHHWTALEASFTALADIAKDVSSRVSGQGGSQNMAQDRQATGQYLLGILRFALSLRPSDIVQQHNVLLLVSIVKFCGAYAVAWRTLAEQQANDGNINGNGNASSNANGSVNGAQSPLQLIIPLLDYLRLCLPLASFQAAKAIRAIYVACFCKSKWLANASSSASSAPTAAATGTGTTNPMISAVVTNIRETLPIALSTGDADTMTAVAEGATRVITQITDPTALQQALSNDLFRPVVAYIEQVANSIPIDPSSVAAASPGNDNGHDHPDALLQDKLDSLSSLFGVVQSIVRFCDASPVPGMGEWVLTNCAALLDGVVPRVSKYPHMLLAKYVAIHQQLLKSAATNRQTIAPVFTKTVSFIIEAFSHTFESTCLAYIATAVEVFGPPPQASSHDPNDPHGSNAAAMVTYDQSFKDLWNHVTAIFGKHLSNNLVEHNPDLIQSYFEVCQRFVLYCPAALLHNEQLPTILELAIQSIAGCGGEQRSTRAALGFLSHFFGWQSLRLSQHAQSMFSASANSVNEQLAANGPRVVQECVASLAGGPQALWPALSDCVISIVTAVMNASPAENETPAHQWLRQAMMQAGGGSDSGSNGGGRMSEEVCQQILGLLTHLLKQEGLKGRNKAKVLLSDFARISRGEMGSDMLLNYIQQ